MNFAMQKTNKNYLKSDKIEYPSFKGFLQDNCAAVSEENEHVCAYYNNNVAPPH
jgi:hypothetical protein